MRKLFILIVVIIHIASLFGCQTISEDIAAVFDALTYNAPEKVQARSIKQAQEENDKRQAEEDARRAEEYAKRVYFSFDHDALNKIIQKKSNDDKFMFYAAARVFYARYLSYTKSINGIHGNITDVFYFKDKVGSGKLSDQEKAAYNLYAEKNRAMWGPIDYRSPIDRHLTKGDRIKFTQFLKKLTTMPLIEQAWMVAVLVNSITREEAYTMYRN